MAAEFANLSVRESVMRYRRIPDSTRSEHGLRISPEQREGPTFASSRLSSCASGVSGNV
jgi:hypothetical protein